MEEHPPREGSHDSSCSTRTLEVSRSARARFISLVADAAERMPPDVVLVAADRSRHSSHRLVLGAWSPFFRSMFCQGMMEQIQGEVCLPDVPADLLRAVLDWMHGKEVRNYVDSQQGLVSLLELAKRWEIDDLCEQLVMQCCLDLEDDTVLAFWEVADRWLLTSLASRCCEYVQSRLVNAFSSSGDTSIPASLLRELTPERFALLIESDGLPVQTEEQTLDLVLAYIDQHSPADGRQSREEQPDGFVKDDQKRSAFVAGQLEQPSYTTHHASQLGSGSSLSVGQTERILSGVRWRLVPLRRITEQVMRHPAVFDYAGNRLKPGTAAVLADAMQYHNLGGKAKDILVNARPLALRSNHRIQVPCYQSLSKGDPVRVIPSTDMLRDLCKRPAPGSSECVGWTPGMEQLAGCLCLVHDLDPETCAAQVEEHEHGYILPFDALLLANS